MPLGIDPIPCGVSRAESQRDSAPKPRVASRELPWEKRVGSAKPNGVVARWWSGDPTPLGLKIARTLTQGSLADSAAGLEDTIPLGLPQAEIRRSKAERSPKRARVSALGFPALGTVRSVAESSRADRNVRAPMPLGIEPMPFGIIRESQRDSDPKPRVASRELPWEKRVVSANPNGVENRTDANPG